MKNSSYHRGSRQLSRKPNRLPHRAAIASAGLSILFLVVYGSCNWISANRPNIGSLYFEWERAIPFIPILIPAYLSLDLFFIGAPFLCKSSDELRLYSKRIAAAILIAGICFLLFPLRFAFERPHANGIGGIIFDGFRTLDAPYNLVPSLHAALLILVGEKYLRHLRGVTRAVALTWFGLIGVSPVLTYQHHVVDIIGGIVLAIGCFYFLPEEGRPRAVATQYRIGLYYVGGAALLLVLAVVFRDWTIALLWPGVALGIIAVSYFGVGPSAYRKVHGRLHWSAQILLAPCLAGQHLSRYYYRRQCRPWDPVTLHLWIGGKLSRREVDQALRSGVTAILDLTAEFSESKPFREIPYCNIQVLDLTAPTQKQLWEMAGFIAAHVQTGIVYVHCKIGYSRSAAAVAAYLLSSGRVERAEDALAMIRQVRPSIIIRSEIVSALDRFEKELSRGDEQRFVLASVEQALA